MAVICIVATVSDQQIADLNGRCQFPTKVNETLNGCKELLSALEGGTLACNVQVTVTSTAPTITPSGTGATQFTYVK